MALTFIGFEKAFDFKYTRTVTEALTSKGVEQPYVETLTKIRKVAKAGNKICNDTPQFLNMKEV